MRRRRHRLSWSSDARHRRRQRSRRSLLHPRTCTHLPYPCHRLTRRRIRYARRPRPAAATPCPGQRTEPSRSSRQRNLHDRRLRLRISSETAATQEDMLSGSQSGVRTRAPDARGRDGPYTLAWEDASRHQTLSLSLAVSVPGSRGLIRRR
jgi:hypothetical protein